jgi:hypothetical protein
MVLTASFVISPAIGFFVTVAGSALAADLNASVEASGPHDFSVRIAALSSSAPPASTASRPNVRDDGQRPSSGRDGGDKQLICVKREAEYFFDEDWTGQISLNRLDNFDFARKSVGRSKGPSPGIGRDSGRGTFHIRLSPRKQASCPLSQDSAMAGTAGRQQAYLTKLRYEASASISSGLRWLTTIGIGDPATE